MPLQVGSRLGHYDVTALIGEGGMGQVYQATDTKLKRQVALKILPEAFSADPERLARFQREAQVLASLNHPNIAAIYGLEESDDTRALVLELVEGPTLADRIKKGAIPLDEALPIAKQIAEALEAAHEAGVIHRDLKPANIKVRDDGTVKVLDFGLAKALDPTPEGDPSQSPTLTAAATQMGVIMGTAAYMSPEQAKGKVADRRSDLWAFGCVLFEVLSGHKVFAGDGVSTTLARVIEREPEWSGLPKATPPAIRRLLRRCLQKERKQRLADVADALLEIEEAGTAPAPSLAPTTAGWWKPVALGTSAVALVMTALAVWTAWTATGGEPAPPTVPTPIAVTPPPDGAVDPRFGLAVAPDGRSVVFGGTDGRLYRRALDQLDAVPIPGASNVFVPLYSPDGQWVAYIDRGDNTLKKIRLDGGQPIALCPIGSVLRSASWGSDDTIVFSYLGSSGLWRVSADGGEPSPAHPGSTGEGAVESVLRWVDLLPDGSAALASVGETDTEHRIVLVDVRTGEQQVLFQGSTPRYATSGHIVYWRQGALWAVPFDDVRREVTGSATPVLEGVAFEAITQRAHFALGGSTLLYVREGEFSTATLVWVDLDGTEEVVEAESRNYGSVQLSPDGRQVVASISIDAGNQDIFTYDLTRETSSRLTATPGTEVFPIWSPDGSEIAFTLPAVGSFWKRADGIGDLRPVTTSTDQAFVLSFSPDGNLAVVGRTTPDTGFDIGMLPTDATVVDWVLAEPHNEAHAQVSPDGRWMAYVSEESGSAEVYVRPFPSVGDGRWQISREGGISPLWGPDSRELFFLTGTNTEAVVMAVGLETDQGFEAGSPRPLFSGPYRVPVPSTPPTWDIAPRGGRFLMLRDAATSAASTSTVVVINWTEELKRLVPTE